MSDTETALSAEEKAFFDKRGEIEAPEPAPQEEQQQPPPAEAAAQPEPSADDDDAVVEEQVGADGKKKRVVDYGALAKERAQRKALQDQLRERDITLARVDERLRAMLSQPQEQEQPKDPPPDWEQDFIGRSKYEAETAAQRIERLEREHQQVVQQSQLAEQQRQLVAAYQSDAAKFAAERADFLDAYNHLVAARRAQLQLQTGGRESPEAIESRIRNEEMGLAYQAFQSGKRPAEIIYEYAKTYGYQPKAVQPANGAHRLPNGQFAPAEKLERIAQAQEANKSLSSAGSSQGGSEMTAARLASLPDDEFQAFKAKNAKRFREMFGD